ncbi:hypothetical protein PIROE2DRAFT_5062 [Piromyces sp. E2]|nr:hypothetical protein PIROE2DRAFT_5062 [Piromyces sp. E2]|eukprot:OUM67529.1 hypothetical protein PIROE2DRAFT_5062 [Piromyces sp. E2]
MGSNHGGGSGDAHSTMELKLLNIPTFTISKFNKYHSIRLFKNLNLKSMEFSGSFVFVAEQRHLNEQLYSSSGSHVPYMEDLATFLTKTIPIISSSMKLLFDRDRSNVKNNINDSWDEFSWLSPQQI